MNFLQALLLGIVQGISEFFPISSSAHLQLARHFLGLPNGEELLTFDLACHLGTWLALAYFLRHELWQTILDPRKIALFAVALMPLIPAYFLLKPLRTFLSSPSYMGYFLLVTSALLFLACKARRFVAQGAVLDGTNPANPEQGIPNGGNNNIFDRVKAPETLDRKSVHISHIDPFTIESSRELSRKSNMLLFPPFDISEVKKWRDVIFIGLSQTVALLPGLSRSGSTIAMARFCGWTWIDGARFSFLLSLPTILGGVGVESLKNAPTTIPLSYCAVGIFSSFAVGMATVRLAFWMYKKNIVWPFALYCLIAGLFMIAIFR